ncbi:hypothetical protein [Thermoflexus sp.]|uniref:hypothetical protein n=1 Tax=Thermoflexus sp. TaxID=1969742 RepID=UPI002623A154|nr:hypothetical protein [Thermoflexus sp.]
MKEIRCKGCGEWIPLSRLDVVEGGIVARRRKFMCPICRTTLYEENPSFEDWFAEELTAGKDGFRINCDTFPAFPRWGKADLDRSHLEEVEVVCHNCKRWNRWHSLKREFTISSSVGWRRIYHCPNCHAQLGQDHGGDPSYNVAPSDFAEQVLKAVREGQGWARPMAPEARTER